MMLPLGGLSLMTSPMPALSGPKLAWRYTAPSGVGKPPSSMVLQK